jgi:DNA repair photolyase
MRSITNPPNPFATEHVEWLGEPPAAKLEVYEERASKVLSENKSPDLPFRWSLNPYRGCIHACAYCYARPTHQYLGYGAGTDFDRRIVVKTNAAEALAREVSRPSWRGEVVALSGNTDCYQPLEASYGLTRRCLEVLRDHDTPVGIVTKAALVVRDIDVLRDMSGIISVSVPFIDDDTGRAIEPWAPKVSRRFDAIAALADAGLDVAVAIAPVIPGLNDADIPAILERAASAGARRAWMVMLRLPAEVEPVFTSRLREALPQRARKVLHAVEDARGGKRNEARFGARMRGTGARWQIIEQLFTAHAKRLGMTTTEAAATPGDRPDRGPRQPTLF